MSGQSTAAHPVEVRYFGPLLDTTGTSRETLDITLPASVAEIDQQLLRNRPGLELHHYRLAVDEALRESDENIEEAREIALLPPFSGG